MIDSSETSAPDPRIVRALRGYIVERILHGESIDLDGQTPLLEWGLIDSMAMVDLLAFIEERFDVELPDDEVKPEHFATLNALSDLITRMRTSDGGNGERKSAAPARMMDPYGVEPKWVDLGPDGKLHLLRAPGPQPTWILLPALGTPASTWVSILRPISEEQEGFAVDLPGFGVSTSPKDVPTFHDHLATVMKLLDVLEAPQYVLIGSSTCAMIAAEIARRTPARVRALIVLGFGRVQDPRAWWARVGGSSEEPSRVLDDAYYHPPSLSPALRQLLADTFNAPAYHTFLDGPALAAMPAIFDGIEVPTLFISGEDDMIMPVAAVTDAAARVPGARVELVARCGHFPHLERSQEVLSIMRAFLDQLPKV